MLALSLAAGAAGAASAASAAERFDVAVTVDDLSVHGPLPHAMTWGGIAQSYLATLKAHRVPRSVRLRQRQAHRGAACQRGRARFLA